MVKVYKKLTYQERCLIKIGIDARKSRREIAKTIDRQPSVVSKEIKKNGGYLWYDPKAAHERPHLSGRKGVSKIEQDKNLRAYIIEKLHEKWSPIVIAGRWNMENNDVKISHETIYIWVHSEQTKPLKLYLLLARMKKKRGTRRSQLENEQKVKPLIHDRPEAINNRSEMGHMEADLVFQKGDRSGNILTCVERVSRFAYLIKNESKHSNVVIGKLNNMAQNVKHAVKSITFDNGSEFAEYEQLPAQSFFCDPGCPWQKGSVENFNGIVRRHLDFRIPIAMVSQKMLDNIAHRLNNTPRKILGFLTPFEVIKKCDNMELEGVASYA